MNTMSSGLSGTNAPKQKQLAHSSDMMRSFKATTNLASALTKERQHIQHDLQKISAGMYRKEVKLMYREGTVRGVEEHEER